MNVMNMSDGVLHVDLQFNESDSEFQVPAGRSLRDLLLFNYDGNFLESSKGRVRPAHISCQIWE